MSGEGLIAAALGILFGGGGVRFLSRLIGPERQRTISKYYREVIAGLEAENRALRKRLAKMETRMVDLEEAVAKVTAGELPPEYS
ncbi:MAG TPA: hypothetical protein VNY83_04930 [Solirubrobacterales bacterium]|nr:hypothetical protein [Solirubrobacterales bacterium]